VLRFSISISEEKHSIKKIVLNNFENFSKVIIFKEMILQEQNIFGQNYKSNKWKIWISIMISISIYKEKYSIKKVY